MGVSRPTKRRTCSASSPRRARAGAAGRGRNSSTSTPHGMTATRAGSAPRCQARSARSTRFEATIRSAPAAMRTSAARRSAGSVSPDPRATAFLIAPSVWNMWTSGTSQRRASSSPATPGQPVVAVDEVVADPFARAERFDAPAERLEVVGHRGPRHRAGGAGGHVDHSRAGPEPHHLRDPGILAPREHVDVEAEAPERARHLAHVDVHPARLLASERGERARVHGEHGESRAARRTAGEGRRHGRSSVTRRTSVGTAPKPYLYGSSPRRKS